MSSEGPHTGADDAPSTGPAGPASRRPEADFADFLARSFDVLAREHPPAHARLRRCMDGRVVHLEVDGHPVDVRFETTGIRVDTPRPGARHAGAYTEADTGAALAAGDPGRDEPVMLARLDRATILDLVDGVVSLPDAILADRFHLRADVDTIARFHDALLLYLRGALRCPGFPALMDAYRAGAPLPP